MSGVLSGLTILLVEDEFLVAALIADCLEDEGATVIGPVGTLPEAEQAAATGEFDAVVLDWNLDGEQSYSVARILLGRGKPCIVATGYGKVDQEFADLPVIAKPFDPALLVRMLATVTEGNSR